MIYISHRGNINGKNIERENTPEYIDEALKNYDVEIDIWFIDHWLYLGHDEPKIKTSFKYISDRSDKLWLHCKNFEALELYSDVGYINANYFWHQNDDFTLTSKNYIWTFPNKELKELTKYSICVLPEISNYSPIDLKGCFGICSDFIEKFKA